MQGCVRRFKRQIANGIPDGRPGRKVLRLPVTFPRIDVRLIRELYGSDSGADDDGSLADLRDSVIGGIEDSSFDLVAQLAGMFHEPLSLLRIKKRRNILEHEDERMGVSDRLDVMSPQLIPGIVRDMRTEIAEPLAWWSADDDIRIRKCIYFVHIVAKAVRSEVLLVGGGGIPVDLDSKDGYKTRLSKPLGKPSRSREQVHKGENPDFPPFPKRCPIASLMLHVRLMYYHFDVFRESHFTKIITYLRGVLHGENR